MTLPADVELRRAATDDAPEVARVLRASRVAVIPLIPPPVHTPVEDVEWVRNHLIPNTDVWLAVDGPRLLAVMAMRPGWLDHLYVAPGSTRHGLGSLLVDQAKSRSPAGLELWVFESNLPARAFYERHGFVAVERTDGSGNEERAPDIRMVWPAARAGSALPH